MKKSGDTASAAERSRWLAELAEAVREAQRLARILEATNVGGGPAIDLCRRLESVRIEIDALRRGKWAPRPTEIDPMRTDPFPWERRHQHWRSEN